MKTELIGAVALVLLPASASATLADEPASKDDKASAEQGAQDQGPEKTEAKEEEKVICRHVRLDVSSRRKTKVCRTKEGWKELNNPR